MHSKRLMANRIHHKGDQFVSKWAEEVLAMCSRFCIDILYGWWAELTPLRIRRNERSSFSGLKWPSHFRYWRVIMQRWEKPSLNALVSWHASEENCCKNGNALIELTKMLETLPAGPQADSTSCGTSTVHVQVSSFPDNTPYCPHLIEGRRLKGDTDWRKEVLLGRRTTS